MQVHIVDDDAAARRAMMQIVSAAGWQAEVHESATEFLDALDGLAFGCVLLDVAMPDHHGLDVLARLGARQPRWPVVMVSAGDSMDDVIAAFRGGALHFLRKPFSRSALEAALVEAEAVVRDRMTPGPMPEAKIGPALSPREVEVLGALNAGEASKTIAFRLGLSIRTVEMHRSNILRKLSARNALQAAATARALGLLRD